MTACGKLSNEDNLDICIQTLRIQKLEVKGKSN